MLWYLMSFICYSSLTVGAVLGTITLIRDIQEDIDNVR